MERGIVGVVEVPEISKDLSRMVKSILLIEEIILMKWAWFLSLPKEKAIVLDVVVLQMFMLREHLPLRRSMVQRMVLLGAIMSLTWVLRNTWKKAVWLTWFRDKLKYMLFRRKPRVWESIGWVGWIWCVVPRRMTYVGNWVVFLLNV